mgnify:FL=1
MIFIAFMRKIKKYEAKELKLTKSELPYTIAMIVLDIAAPICLLFGLKLYNCRKMRRYLITLKL